MSQISHKVVGLQFTFMPKMPNPLFGFILDFVNISYSQYCNYLFLAKSVIAAIQRGLSLSLSSVIGWQPHMWAIRALWLASSYSLFRSLWLKELIEQNLQGCNNRYLPNAPFGGCCTYENRICLTWPFLRQVVESGYKTKQPCACVKLNCIFQ